MLMTLGLSVALAAGRSWRPLPARGRAVFLILFLVLLALMSRGATSAAGWSNDYNAGAAPVRSPSSSHGERCEKS